MNIWEKKKTLEVKIIYQIFGELIGALQTLFYSSKISLRDIKPKNIFIKKEKNK